MPHSYEDYDEKASTYTSLRRAIGCEKEASFFLGSQWEDGYGTGVAAAPHEKKLLDSGCGTGNYAVEFLNKYGFQEIHCTDFNGAMVKEAEKNVKTLASEQAQGVKFSADNVCDMKDIPSNYFDCVCNNQVVHHLRPDSNFQDLKEACKEWHRVLKSGGKIAINWSPAEHVLHGMFWAELIPNAFKKWAPRSPSKQVMEEALTSAGFKVVDIVPLKEEILYDPQMYFDPRNFLDWDRFSRSDSNFNLVTEEEKQQALKRVETMLENGELAKWFAGKERERLSMGQTVTVFAEKA